MLVLFQVLKELAGKNMITSLSCDLLIRIKNGSRAGRKSISAPLSKYSVSILEKLKKHGFIADFSVNTEEKIISIKEPRVLDIELFSRPGRRLYCSSSSLPWGKTPKSLIIISTSSGLLSQKEAAVKKLGGELVAEIW
jgi:small subunit ribosomal protein S8